MCVDLCEQCVWICVSSVCGSVWTTSIFAQNIVRVLVQLIGCHICDGDFDSIGKLAKELMSLLSKDLHKPDSPKVKDT